MASVRVRLSGGSGSQEVQVVASHRRSFHLPKSNQQLCSNSNSRFKNTARLQVRQTLFTALASNSNPTGRTGPGTNDPPLPQPQGPPVLTIDAGFLVFILVSWIVGSTLMSLIALILRLFPSNYRCCL